MNKDQQHLAYVHQVFMAVDITHEGLKPDFVVDTLFAR